MSTILKALQKVEGKRQVGDTPFPEDLLLFEKPRDRRTGIRALLLLLVAGILSGAAGWQVYSRLTAGVANRLLSRPLAGDADHVLPRSQAAPPAVNREPAAPSEAGMTAAISAEGPATPRKPERPAADVASVPRAAPSKPAVRTPAVTNPVAAGRLRLVVSGIAYQEDQAGRLAVVNDRPVGEGEEIGGAVVTAILEDRVRFSRAGETFEIGLATKEY